jgi:16S rRNA (uracil1498-N3)-methyltransferase
MFVPRFYCPQPLAPGASIMLPAAAAHHAARVLRLKSGDRCVLFNGDGAEYAAAIERFEGANVTVAVGERAAVTRESPLAVTLAQALCAGDKMDLVVQKAVELGVSRIAPVEAEKGVVRLKGERAGARRAHWRAVVVAACEQCGRNRLPELDPPRPLLEWLAAPPPGRRWLLSPQGGRSLAEVGRPENGIVLLSGPEAGFSAGEEQAARAAGFEPLRLGPRVLRAETAALAALAAIQARWGDY